MVKNLKKIPKSTEFLFFFPNQSGWLEREGGAGGGYLQDPVATVGGTHFLTSMIMGGRVAKTA